MSCASWVICYYFKASYNIPRFQDERLFHHQQRSPVSLPFAILLVLMYAVLTTRSQFPGKIEYRGGRLVSFLLDQLYKQVE